MRSARSKWTRAIFIFILAAAAASPASANFTGGPSVRVTPNAKIEIRWIADFVGSGKVEVFDNANGTGTPIDTKVGGVPANDHTIEFGVGPLLKADTTYFFKVTHSDPNNVMPPLTNDPAPFPPVFTGVQAIGNIFVVADTDSAVISRDANSSASATSITAPPHRMSYRLRTRRTSRPTASNSPASRPERLTSSG